MPPENTGHAPAPPPPTRLNGWKEIASYFGRGVRTVQRWEKDLGLPVRRINTRGAEVVYALVADLERWQESAAAKRAAREGADPNGAPDDPTGVVATGAVEPSQNVVRPAGSRRAVTWIAIGAVVVAIVATLTWVRFQPQAGQPASWKVANNALTIFDANGRFLWEHRFDFHLTESSYYARTFGADGVTPVVTDDIDGDGNVEVLFVAEPWMPNGQGLFCFDHRGALRFQRTPTQVVRFGAPGRPHDIWFVSSHQTEFPTVLEKLDVSGNVRGEYWSNGQISTVVTGQLAGRSLAFVCAISNEFKGGSLAVLEANQPFGAAPAASDYYRCTGCPAGTPVAFFVFPRLDVTAALGQHSHVSNVFVDTLGQIMVDVLHYVGEGVPRDLQRSATSQYSLDQFFRVNRTGNAQGRIG
jgi:hypothetical protein